MYKTIALLMSMILAFVTGAMAQVEQATVQVDGLSCPFCAYGLEKKLKKVEGVQRLEIKVDTGAALMIVEKGKMLSIEAVEQAVKDGGFTPRGVMLTAMGRLVADEGQMVLVMPDSELRFVIEGDEGLQKLVKALGNEERTVRLTGPISRIGDGENQQLLYTIAIKEFKIL